VWIALLNMEYKFGSTESLEQSFARAVAESKVRSMNSFVQYESQQRFVDSILIYA
jgi:hypothetical protein